MVQGTTGDKNSAAVRGCSGSSRLVPVYVFVWQRCDGELCETISYFPLYKPALSPPPPTRPAPARLPSAWEEILLR